MSLPAAKETSASRIALASIAERCEEVVRTGNKDNREAVLLARMVAADCRAVLAGRAMPHEGAAVNKVIAETRRRERRRREHETTPAPFDRCP